MATGYTHDVAEGKVQDFPTFAWQCARAFGALVEMRDDPASAPIPEEFKPSDHHTTRLAEAEAELSRLKALSEGEKAEGFGRFRAQTQIERRKHTDDCDLKRDRYQGMLAKVRAWKPPTPDHQGMKDFMEEQLSMSIKHDCTPMENYPKTYDTRQEWHAAQIESAAWSVEYHKKEQANEEKRCRERTKWIADLRASLTQEQPR